MISNRLAVFCAAGAALLLTSCYGTAVQAPTNGGFAKAVSVSERRGEAPARPPKLIFLGVYDDNALGHIDIFDAATHKQIYEIESLRVPNALATDRSGNLYEGDGVLQSIQVFAPPYKSAPKELSDSGYSPNGLHVDASGNLWVANYCKIVHYNCGGAGDVVEFPNGSSNATALNGGPYDPVDVATNANGDVWADGLDAQGNCVVGYWKGGAGSFVSYGIDCNDPHTVTNVPGGITFDKSGNMLLWYAKQDEGRIGIFPPGHTTPANVIMTYGRVLGITLGPVEDLIYAVYWNGGGLRIYAYPQGSLKGHLNGNGHTYSAAVYPAPLP